EPITAVRREGDRGRCGAVHRDTHLCEGASSDATRVSSVQVKLEVERGSGAAGGEGDYREREKHGNQRPRSEAVSCGNDWYGGLVGSDLVWRAKFHGCTPSASSEAQKGRWKCGC